MLEYQFNHQWLVTEVRRIAPDGTPASLGRREWDGDGMLLAEIDAAGNATRYTYDEKGNLTALTDPKQHTTRVTYDDQNQAVAITDALGNTSLTRYDASGRIVETRDRLDRRTAFSYDKQGRMDTVTDARGGVKQLDYDDAGRLVALTDCSRLTTRFAYDRAGRLLETTDALGGTLAYQYDAHGNVVVATRADGSAERFDYDGDGNLRSHTGYDGKVMRYRYNGHGLIMERIDANGHTLRYRYDKALRISELINENDETYRFVYDAESLLVAETGFDGKVTSYVYDRAGQLVASECHGVRSEYARDALGQLQAACTADAAVRYAYDALGRLTAVATAQTQQRYAYDAEGQLVDERIDYALAAPDDAGAASAIGAAFSMTHEYDVLGNRIQTILPNGRKVDTQRYGSGHWHGTLWQGRSIVDLERDHLHRETSRSIGSGAQRLVELRSYDPQSRLSHFVLNKDGQRLRERRYTYDSSGNLAQIDDKLRGSMRYAYDPVGRILSAVQPDLREVFAFDPAGNLLDAQERRSDTGQVLTEQPLAGAAPALAKVTHNLLRQYLGYAYEYDVQGNAVSKRWPAAGSANDGAQLVLGYDPDNRVVEATRSLAGSEQRTRYTYDGFGRRIAKQCIDASGGACRTALFVWDGDLLVQEIDAGNTVSYVYETGSFVPLAKIESAGGYGDYQVRHPGLSHVAEWDLPPLGGDAAGQVGAWRAHQSGVREQDYLRVRRERLAQAGEGAANDRIYYYQCDHLGTPLELLDEQGATVWSARYRAWGDIFHCESRGVEQPLRFQGQYHDQETGLYYNRHRYYDPEVGRYLTQDPIGLFGGSNPYVYGPNPTGWTDPHGLARTPYSGNCADDAARSVLPAANAKSIRMNKEYGGLIYEKGGKFFATIPVSGTGRTFTPARALPQVPRGAKVVGDYHTHGDYSLEGKNGSVVRTSDPMRDSFNSDEFSKSDTRITQMATLQNPCHASYLGTPSGKFLKQTVNGGVREL